MKKHLFILLILTATFFISRPALAQTIYDEDSDHLLWISPIQNFIQFPQDNFGAIEENRIIHAADTSDYFIEKSDFPERYDAREAGLITSVKDQRPYDLGWAESAMSMAESNLIKKRIFNPDIDLSEIFLHYFQWFRVPDPLGLTAGDQNKWYPYESYDGFVREWINSSGSGYRAVLLLSGWPGLALEKSAPYPSPDADITNYSLDSTLAWNSSVARLDDALWISTTDTQAVKRMIMKKGSAVIACSQDLSIYLNEETGAYYSPEFANANNYVNVIGWDDNYPAYNFRIQPENNGAWLVKNSFGTDWGNDGYFWLSYADKTISEDAFIFDFTEPTPGMKVYQYDGTVSYNYINDQEASSITAANIFTAVDNERLDSVGFLTPSSYFDYKIDVYRGVKDTPDSGILFSSQSGSELYAGYHTIDLETPVDLCAGDRFSVIVEISTSISGTAYLMTDRSESYKTTDAKGKEVTFQEFISSSKSGESFYKDRNGSWVDCWNKDPELSLGNVRIKAYTKFVSYSSVKSPVDNPNQDTEEKFLQFIRLDKEDADKPAPNFR